MYFKVATAFTSLLLLVQLNIAVQIPDHMKAQAKKIHNRCMNQTGVSEALIAQGRTGKMPSDQTFKCYLHCIFDKIGLIDSDHSIHLEYFAEILPEEVRSNILNLHNACGTKTGEDVCDSVFKTVNCYFETDADFITSTINTFVP